MIKITKDLVFIEEPRGYFYKGKRMSGITGLIGKRLNKRFPSEGEMPKRILDARDFGTAIHNDVETYCRTGFAGRHPSSWFCVSFLEKNYPIEDFFLFSELLVTDKKKYATAIDIVAIHRKTKKVHTFDIKTGVFNRDYCSWQLGVGNYLLGKTYELNVESSFVIATKDERIYEIIPKRESRVIALLKK